MHELDCRAFEHSLDAYLDGELDPSARVEMELHLHQCASCKARQGVALTVRQRLHEGCASARAPEGLKARILARLDCLSGCDQSADEEAEDAAAHAALQAALRADGSGPVPMVTATMRAQAEAAVNADAKGEASGWRRWVGWQAVSVALVTLALAGLSGWGLLQGAQTPASGRLEGSVWSASAQGQAEQALLEESVDWHQRQLPVEVTGPHGDEVGRWFRGKLDFQVQVPRFARKDVTLLGGRLAHLRDRRAALLTLAVRQQKVSLFVVPRQVMGPPEGLRFVAPHASGQRRVLRQVSGYSVAMVQDGDLVYVIAADLPARELEQLVRLAFEVVEGGSR